MARTHRQTTIGALACLVDQTPCAIRTVATDTRTLATIMGLAR